MIFRKTPLTSFFSKYLNVFRHRRKSQVFCCNTQQIKITFKKYQQNNQFYFDFWSRQLEQCKTQKNTNIPHKLTVLFCPLSVEPEIQSKFCKRPVLEHLIYYKKGSINMLNAVSSCLNLTTNILLDFWKTNKSAPKFQFYSLDFWPEPSVAIMLSGNLVANTGCSLYPSRNI